jgi:hypothetical protein
MTKCVQTPQTLCRAAVARCEVTPPVGIYHRMWGASTHERATGIHRPLLATLLWLGPLAGDSSQALVIVGLDHCILDEADLQQMREAIGRAANLRPAQVLISLSHTHAAGLMSRSRANCEGGELIGPYLDALSERLGQLASQAVAARQPTTIVYGAGRCCVAAHRDFYDDQRQQFVCGFNPQASADDTLVVARIAENGGQTLATIVNYACHPTTLAWQNTLISPDYVGTLRETVEQHTSAACLFLQGASGDLGPREGFLGDPEIADRNGRQIGFAALAALEALPPPHTEFVYSGPVVSGATLGTWHHRPLDETAIERLKAWRIVHSTIPLEYRPKLPSLDQAKADLERWQAAEATTAEAASRHDAHARVEQAKRQVWRLGALPPERFPLPITVARLGDAIWLFVAGEHYQSLQTAVRAQFPDRPVLVTTLSNGWQPGYIPPANVYGRGIYQEQISVVAQGSAERVEQDVCRLVQESLSSVVG